MAPGCSGPCTPGPRAYGLQETPPRPGGHRWGQDAPPCASACLPSNGDRNSTMSQRPCPGDHTTVPGWPHWPVGCATTWGPTLRRPRAHSLLCCHHFGIWNHFNKGPCIFSLCYHLPHPTQITPWVPVALLPGSRPEPCRWEALRGVWCAPFPWPLEGLTKLCRVPTRLLPYGSGGHVSDMGLLG